MIDDKMKDYKIKKAGIAFLSCIILSSIIPFPAYAGKEEDLAQTKKDIEQSQARKADISAQKKKLETDLKSIQEKLVISAKSTQDAESDLTRSEDKLRILNEQLVSKNEQMKSQREKLATLTQAALRLSQIPPEAMVMMPGDEQKTMQAARALKMASEAIREETESLGLQMAELQTLKQKVAKNLDTLGRKQSTLDKERKTLEKQAAERKALQEKLSSDEQAEAEKLAALAKKAEDLQGLLSSLKRESSYPTAEHRQQTVLSSKGKLRSFASARGQLKMPVTGRVIRLFGVTEGRNSTSRGVTVATRDRAQVTAPFDGEVLFTGPFLNYGPLVIIRHSDDFHTLLAGLDTIGVKAGQFLLEGEPIGAMGDSDEGNRLYLELRKNNQPVDPAPWINGLTKK